MAKRRVVYRSTRARRRGRKGFLGGIKLFDVSQGMYNAHSLGYFTAADQAIKGDLKGAGTTLATAAYSPTVALNMMLTNTFIGINRRVLRATGGRFVRRFIA